MAPIMTDIAVIAAYAATEPRNTVMGFMDFEAMPIPTI
jgi:hypothetical protein